MGDKHNEFSRQSMIGDALGEFENGQPDDQIVLAGEIAYMDPNEFIEYLKLISDPDYVLNASKRDVFAKRILPGENEPTIKVLCNIKFENLVDKTEADDEEGFVWEQLDKRSKPIESRLSIYRLEI